MLKNRAEAIINTENLAHNFKKIRAMAGGSRVISVVKADAYGHGAAECAHVIERCGGDMFAVASADEGAALRESGIAGDILVLGISTAEEQKRLHEFDLIQSVASREYADELGALGYPVRIHIKIDTGMSRLGFYCHGEEDTAAAYEAVRDALEKNKSLKCEGVFTHFACSDEPYDSMTRRQFGAFSAFCGLCEKGGLGLGMRHCCNSAAIVNFPEMHLDAVRAGILLYGLSPNPGVTDAAGLLPCMTLKANVVQLSHIRKGDTVSYGAAFVSDCDMTVATLSVGYADGLLRALSGKADVVIRGKKAKMVGKICMDMCMADVSGIDCEVGDEAVIFGDGQSADRLAELAGTINYEILCSVRNRVSRRYI